jgi:hypothetical protein
MLTAWCQSHSSNTSLSRRGFLRAGAFGLGGLTLPDLLRLRAETGVSSPRAVIMVCLAGGPSHIDSYDPKPTATSDYRGEFQPIQSNVPGFDLCEHMPLQAKIADKLALIRSLQWQEPMQHELEEVYSGFTKAAKRPSFGSVISKYRAADAKLPSYVSLEYSEGNTSYESPQYLGAAHRPLHIAGTEGVRNLSLNWRLTPAKLDDRKNLLDSLDTVRRDADHARDLDPYTARALDIITSPKAREAFDLTLESPRLRNQYGLKNEMFTYVGKAPDSYWYPQNFLLARRLVEAGVPVVTLRAGLWDHHGNVIQQVGGASIWHSLKSALPLLDRSIHTLVTDLHERGLEKEVMVLVWGEFGRTPKISQAGRDHWPSAGFALMAGGGLKTGQVIGETDSKGAEPKTRPLGPQNVLATVYTALGIDPSLAIPDFSGRPIALLDDPKPIAELF